MGFHQEPNSLEVLVDGITEPSITSVRMWEDPDASTTANMERIDRIYDVLSVMLEQSKGKYNYYDHFSVTRSSRNKAAEVKDEDVAAPPAETTTPTPSPPSPCCSDPWRNLMIQWMWTVVDTFHLSAENVALATYYLDQCDLVDEELVTSPSDYQLMSVAALQLSVKMLEYEVIPLSQFVRFLGNSFCEQDIVTMELRIMGALKWNLNPPTAYLFLGYYQQLLPETIPTEIRLEMNEYALKLLRLSISDDMYLQTSPSVIAYASLIHAMERMGNALDVEEKRTIALRLQQGADLDTNSCGLRTAFATMACLLMKAAMPPPPLSAKANEASSASASTEEQQQPQPIESPHSILHHCFVQVPTKGDEGIEIIPDFGSYDDDEDEYLMEGCIAVSPRNVVEGC